MLPWLVILAVIIIIVTKVSDYNICIIGSSNLNGEFQQLEEKIQSGGEVHGKLVNRISSYLTKDNMNLCHEIYILESDPREDQEGIEGQRYGNLKIRNTEYFMFLIQLYDKDHLFRGILSNNMTADEIKEVMTQE